MCRIRACTDDAYWDHVCLPLVGPILDQPLVVQLVPAHRTWRDVRANTRKRSCDDAGRGGGAQLKQLVNERGKLRGPAALPRLQCLETASGNDGLFTLGEYHVGRLERIGRVEDDLPCS